jgi:hypothetical protein
MRRLLYVLALAQPLAAQPDLAAPRGLFQAVPGGLPTAIGYRKAATAADDPSLFFDDQYTRAITGVLGWDRHR